MKINRYLHLIFAMLFLSVVVPSYTSANLPYEPDDPVEELIAETAGENINEDTQKDYTPEEIEGIAKEGMKLDCFESNGKCGVNVYKMLGIKKSNQNIKAKDFVSDIVLSATMFFGTLLTIIILFSGFLYIFSAMKGSENLQSKAKSGIIGGIIGLLLVSGSFAIVRIVQFILQAS